MSQEECAALAGLPGNRQARNRHRPVRTARTAGLKSWILRVLIRHSDSAFNRTAGSVCLAGRCGLSLPWLQGSDKKLHAVWAVFAGTSPCARLFVPDSSAVLPALYGRGKKGKPAQGPFVFPCLQLFAGRGAPQGGGHGQNEMACRISCAAADRAPSPRSRGSRPPLSRRRPDAPGSPLQIHAPCIQAAWQALPRR